VKLLGRDLRDELLMAARLRWEDLIIKHPEVDVGALAVLAATWASRMGEKRLSCYRDRPHRQVWVQPLATGQEICIGRPFCWFPRQCLVHGDRIADRRAEGWYGQLIKCLAMNLVDLTRSSRGLVPASWYEIVLDAPVDSDGAEDWDDLIGSLLDVADRFRKRRGFRWGDLLNRRGYTRLGKPRKSVIDARADEWLAEGYIRLILGNHPHLPMTTNGNPSRAGEPRHPPIALSSWYMGHHRTQFD
jgi:hypothetical protein